MMIPRLALRRLKSAHETVTALRFSPALLPGDTFFLLKVLDLIERTEAAERATR